MSIPLDEITVVEVGVPGPAGAGITAAQYTDVLTRLTALEAVIGVAVQDEGSALSTRGQTLNFVGSGVTASGTTATKTITIPGAGTPGIITQLNDSTVDAAATTLDFASPFTLTSSPSGEANVGHGNHNPVLIYRATKSYSSSALSTTDTAFATINTDPLTNGLAYAVFAFGIAQVGGGAGNAEIGVRILSAGSTFWGMQVGTVGGERPAAASASAPVTGSGAAIEITLRGRTTTGSGSIQAAHLVALLFPRQ